MLVRYGTGPLPLPATQWHGTLWVAGRGSGPEPSYHEAFPGRP
jgi:hypothetical protein